MNTASAFVIGLLTLAVIGVAVLVVLGAIPTTDTPNVNEGAAACNATDRTACVSTGALVSGNVSGGLTSLFTQAGTWFTLLSVTIIILIISVVIFVVRRFGDTGTGDGTL